MIRRPPRSTLSSSSAASDVYKRQGPGLRARAAVGVPRANCWTIAEHTGESTPDGMQHLLARAVWDDEAVRDDLRGYVVEHLGDPEAVLIIDETGDVKKGSATVGVQRQYTGTAGRVENAQVGVYLVYAGAGGHACSDRAPEAVPAVVCRLRLAKRKDR